MSIWIRVRVSNFVLRPKKLLFCTTATEVESLSLRLVLVDIRIPNPDTETDHLSTQARIAALARLYI
jgi:hypothetical protein